MNRESQSQSKLLMNALSQYLSNCEKNKEDCICIMNVYDENKQPKFSGLCANKKTQENIYNLFRNELKKINNDIEY